jgi:predicted small lipoprotein YifL
LVIALSALAACGKEGPLVSSLASPTPVATTFETPIATESPVATESPEATESATPAASETPEATAATSQPAGRSGIYGSVTTTCPSTQTATPCPEEPVAGAEVTAKDESGKVAGTARTDAQGKFEMALSPGTYEVTANAGGCTKERAEVTEGHFTPVHIDCYGVPS